MMKKYGGHGIDVQLRDMTCTDDVVWVSGNSYVKVAVPETATDYTKQYMVHVDAKGRQYLIVSVNGIGEIRWPVNNNYDLHRPENKTVQEYFHNR